MKVLWFIPIPPKQFLEHYNLPVSGTGFWIHSLIDELAQRSGIELHVAFISPKSDLTKCFINGVNYHPLGQKKTSLTSIISKIPGICQWINSTKKREVLSEGARCIQEVQPDLIHVHGTESLFGLLRARKITTIPLLVSLQGIMSECAKYSWGEKSMAAVFKQCLGNNPLKSIGFLLKRRRYRKRAQLEKEILSGADGVLGRTDWDRAFVWSIFPHIPYYHVDELMRPEFSEAEWNLSSAQKHRVYTSGRLTFAKGMHVFLDAMAILHRDYPDLSVYIAGGNSPTIEYRSLIKKIKQLGLDTCVTFTGWIPGPEIVEQLQKTHVYANASFIENGCNALEEAMLMGVPCVSMFAGGMPSILEHKKTGLMAPRGNAFLLADAIRKIFLDDKLAHHFAKNAKMDMRIRLAPSVIVDSLMKAYQSAIKSGH